MSPWMTGFRQLGVLVFLVSFSESDQENKNRGKRCLAVPLSTGSSASQSAHRLTKRAPALGTLRLALQISSNESSMLTHIDTDSGIQRAGAVTPHSTMPLLDL